MTTAHTPGPWTVSCMRLTIAPALGRDTRLLEVGPSEERLALVYFDMKTGLGLADARLIAAAPDLLEGGTEQTAILRAAQEILTRYLVPDGIDAPQAITELLGLLDGPTQRSAQTKWDAAVKKAKGV